MATSKTLNPTNVSISIPALGDAPDASVFSNCIDKEADAINALNSQIGKYQGTRAWVAGANCNDYTTEGLYMLSDNLTNAPLTWFTLTVYAPRNDAITQIAMKTPNEIYIRFYTSSWSAWDKLALNSQLAKFKTKSLTGTAGSTGALSTNIPNTNIILGQKVNNASNNITLSGFVSFNGYWYVQTEPNSAVDLTLMYYEP